MKRPFCAALAAALALACLPFSACSHVVNTVAPLSTQASYSTAPSSDAPSYSLPLGYSKHDYDRLVCFLEQADEAGVKNGQKLNSGYDPSDPETWGTARALNSSSKSYAPSPRFQWTSINGEKRIERINIYSEVPSRALVGSLDVSGCTALSSLNCSFNLLTDIDASYCTSLTELYCFRNRLSSLSLSENTALTVLSCYQNRLPSLSISGCTALADLNCSSNLLADLDVSGLSALRELDCADNKLSELNVSENTSLVWLSCGDNMLAELDVSKLPSLTVLNCCNNRLTKLDLSANDGLRGKLIRVDGSGSIGYCGSYELSAAPKGDSILDGFYNENGELISGGEWDTASCAYRCPLAANAGSIVVRFTDRSPAGTN